MDFYWTKEQIEIKESVSQFTKKLLIENLVELDQQELFNLDGWKKCGEWGIMGLPIPQEYGGKELDPLTTIYALEGLGYGCKDNGLLFSIAAHTWACEIPLLTFGTPAQKLKYLPKLAKGEFIGAHAVTEIDAGSDVYSLQTTAQKQGDKYILNGSKMFVTNGEIANLILVFANIQPERGKRGITCFLVEKDSPGFIVKRKMSKMGLKTAQMAELILDNCEVPVANLLLKEGAGMAVFSHSMEWERGFILASAIGTMERLIEQCTQYAKQRQQFQQPIGKFQLIASKLVDMKMRLETARSLLYKFGWLKQQGKSALMEAAMAKLYISESWVQSCLDAIQIHGGYGYLTELELERELRDALGSRLYSGTSEIQYQIIAQFMGL
ncbi:MULTISPECIES: acyl-CoA dehydrogenase family protein [Planktothrix]|jgi:alkylation response protein AidB-like acyl-CoA dehydrogenase|uniref:acyl-CoA dehydrogenase family protein n=1 Tax=Planktothrix TaxID=54304 RepID=UPI0003FDA3E8|nr:MULTISPECIES: acyl-CoA dehydrogenase family protein [Planktothrix]CAD0230302.1 Flavoprotein desaturase PigA [Planktothrix agardhii]CAD5910763.1 L-prolyl-[peptidyl-carrier protein] dehydrogenase [Planktothrix agardhii]CAD5985095.1 L-prolyl-[peptidyl-carrier protein] dehydrogenase [Planktothrix rubescens]